MRNRSMRRSFAFTVLVCACLLSGVSLAVSGAFGSGRQAGDLSDQIRECRKALGNAQDELRSANELEALFNRKTRVPPALRQALGDELPGMILTPGAFGTAFAIDVQATVKNALLQYAQGNLTADQLSRALVRLAALAGRTKRLLAETRREARAEVDKVRARCAALVAKQNQAPKPPPAQAGSFKLVGQVDAAKDITNPNAVTLTIDAANNKATNENKPELGGGRHKVEYSWKLPRTLTPGEKSSVTLKIAVIDDPSRSQWGLRVLAPGLAQQLLARDEPVERTYGFTVPAGDKDAKELTIRIHILSAEVIYHYRR
jgi:hypothetical protein